MTIRKVEEDVTWLCYEMYSDVYRHYGHDSNANYLASNTTIKTRQWRFLGIILVTDIRFYFDGAQSMVKPCVEILKTSQ